MVNPPRTVPIVCGKSRQKRGASIAVYGVNSRKWYCASCGRRVAKVVYVR